MPAYQAGYRHTLEELWMRSSHATIKSVLPKAEDFQVESPEYAEEGAVRWVKKVGDFVLAREEVCQVQGTSTLSVAGLY